MEKIERYYLKNFLKKFTESNLLQKLSEDLKNVQDHLQGSQGQEYVRQIHINTEAIWKDTETIKEMIGMMQVREDDLYEAKYTVPPNQTGLILNVDDDGTFEGQLKRIVLQNKARQVGAVGKIQKWPSWHRRAA